MRLASAPRNSAIYRQLFIADLGEIMPIPAPRDNAPSCNADILRVGSNGEAVPFASGFASPLGLRFIDVRPAGRFYYVRTTPSRAAVRVGSADEVFVRVWEPVRSSPW